MVVHLSNFVSVHLDLLVLNICAATIRCVNAKVVQFEQSWRWSKVVLIYKSTVEVLGLMD